MTVAIPDLKTSLETDGFCVVQDLLTAQEVKDYASNLQRLCAECRDDGKHPHPRLSIQYEKGFNPAGLSPQQRELGIRKFHSAGLVDPWFWETVRQQKLRAIIESVLGPRPKILQTMALVKPPEIGSPKDWHQDTPYFRLTPHNECIGVWVGIDDATLENGCMQVVPGTHRLGELPHVEGPSGWRLDPQTIAAYKDRIVALPMKAGSALIFSGLLLHFTDHNTTKQRRRAFQYHYVSERTTSPGNLSQTYRLDSETPPLANAKTASAA